LLHNYTHTHTHTHTQKDSKFLQQQERHGNSSSMVLVRPVPNEQNSKSFDALKSNILTPIKKHNDDNNNNGFQTSYESLVETNTDGTIIILPNFHEYLQTN